MDAHDLVDPEGRPVTHLRMSLTQKCNLACTYCHHEGERNPGPEMSGACACDILAAFARHGVRKLKLTGGEPLLREDIADVIRYAKDAGFTEVSLTTNGTLLEGCAGTLKKAGLDRLNIGCDSLSSSLLAKNSRTVLPALAAAREAGFDSIKLNMVILRGVNDHEVNRMIEFAGQQSATLQIIELIPTGDGYYERYHLDLGMLEEDLRRRACAVLIRKLQGRKKYHLPGVDVEVVRPFHSHFCRRCTKMRVTSDSLLRPCLMRNDLYIPFDGDRSILEAVSLRRAYSTP